ncbi:type II secretion system protein GspK [Rhodoplanes sp. TEM]|uniref:Type II secretion system protein GspK n=1 Tax=Rhodoplanes tepidamans TaxID=200616 RepID=A0ABT5JCF4_RHOTP|nr:MULTISPECIES: type II secretion system protein GspK [Rhodoplanes]MDC7787292.1 type II secretion system protein GspK [Rhodoplanes tepidamans]MDC7985320.1 type II secretion system protein GspK [Rhodoplanes sp. TEM]MDQ0357827.1 general secretion pathway protein K [Rhodoplanes tepidamans]
MSRARPSPTSGGPCDGFVLIAVLWILAALATLVTIYSVHVSGAATAAAVRDEALLARALATAGVELAAQRLAAVPKEVRPTRGDLAFRRGRARVLATFVNEAARIDLNAAPKELLAGLFVVLGAQPDDADTYAERIVAWRAPSGDATLERERSRYREAGLDHGPRGKPFVHADELWLVLGIPPALIEQALPHLTIYGGRPDVLARDADPVVLAALPGETPDGPAGNAPPLRRGTTPEGGDAVRVTVRIDFDRGGTRAAEAVILVRDFGDDPYRVLTWRDDLDTPPPLRPPQETRR